jgi:glycosyltransferase involved in cell wall biosynthesis
MDGMKKYVEHWNGPVSVVAEPTTLPTSNLDEVEIDPGRLPFKLVVSSFLDPLFAEQLMGQHLVLGSLHFHQKHLASLCQSIGVRCVYVAENTLGTRVQILRADTRNPVVAARRFFWECGQERRLRAAIRLAAGVQCNGTPTYEAYRAINARPFLFFDTRVTEDLLATEQELATKAAVSRAGRPLRLIFSGRLIPIKGADQLIKVAVALRRVKVPFEMTIYGGGESEPLVRSEIDRHRLGGHVTLGGVLDFKTELVPVTKSRADLFVCCHRSGDPSCTYLEVMSCGVPIVGYDNRALRGVVRESTAGWTTPMGRPESLAEKIAELARDRERLVTAARKALEFGVRNTFERTCVSRINHMKECLYD